MFGVADIESEPAFSQILVPDGFVVPSPEGLTAKDIRYWLVHEAVSLIGPFIVTVGDLVDPV